MARTGDWLQTYTGRQFWPLDPHPDDIDIRDIARSLSRQCRFAGHTRRFYSVAEHCCHVSSVVAPENALAALLHDASEAYLLDVPRPLKPYLSNYRDIEERIERTIAEKFGVAYPWHIEIKAADNRILMDEKAALMGPEPAPWGVSLPPLGATIECWSPSLAESQFLHAFRELSG